MTEKTTPYDSIKDYGEMVGRLYRDSNELAEEAYGATQEPLGEEALSDLIGRGQAQMGYYETLLEKHTAGQRDGIKRIGRNIDLLAGFLQTLIDGQKSSKRGHS